MDASKELVTNYARMMEACMSGSNHGLLAAILSSANIAGTTHEKHSI